MHLRAGCKNGRQILEVHPYIIEILCHVVGQYTPALVVVVRDPLKDSFEVSIFKAIAFASPVDQTTCRYAPCAADG